MPSRRAMTATGSPLGKPTQYPERYDPTLLYPMPRAPQRRALGIEGALPFGGADLWTAYEITWLDGRGKPELAVGRFRVPADSPSLIESKSLKLYLGSFAQEKVGEREALARRIGSDLSDACGAHVSVSLVSVRELVPAHGVTSPAESLDELALDTDVYAPEPAYLVTGAGNASETLHSALFRARCPVTSQPDYADVMIRYDGPRIDRAGVLRYLVSYRCHAAFHESCVEQIFLDISRRCAPRRLTVYARFLRRGGIDINPFRSNFEPPPTHPVRTARQ